MAEAQPPSHPSCSPSRAGCPGAIRKWSEEHYAFAGYVTGFDPAEFADRAALRAELGYGEEEQVRIVTVGGSGVGGDLLRRVIAAFPDAKERMPALRMIVVAGPRSDPATLPAHDGPEVRAYVHQPYRDLAARGRAVVQGGLTTSMEPTAHRRPFLYCSAITSSRTSTSDTDSTATTPDAASTSSWRRRTRSPRRSPRRSVRGSTTGPVESDGAARAAALIAPLLEQGKGRRPPAPRPRRPTTASKEHR
jgi:hypothetical protein